MENRNFYIYEYVRLDNNTTFYVGKGTKNRMKQIHNRSKHWKHIMEKTEIAGYILYDNLTENEAFELEKNIIEQYVFEEGYGIKCKNFDYVSGEPYLVNATWGGEGASGLKFSQETKNKLSENSKTKRKVVCINTGKIYEKATIAAEKLNVNCGNIIQCCKNKREYAGYCEKTKEKLIWAYYEDYLKMSEENIKKLKERAISSIIICLNTKELFHSTSEVVKKCNVNGGALSQHLSGKRNHCKNLIFKWYKDII